MSFSPAQAQLFNEWTNSSGDSNYQNPANWFLQEVPDFNNNPTTANILFQGTPGLVVANAPVHVDQIQANTNSELYLDMNNLPMISNDILIGLLPVPAFLSLSNSPDITVNNNILLAPQTGSYAELRILNPTTVVTTQGLYTGFDQSLISVESNSYLVVENGAKLRTVNGATLSASDNSTHLVEITGNAHWLATGMKSIGNPFNPVTNGSTTLLITGGGLAEFRDPGFDNEPGFPSAVDLGYGGEIIIDGGTLFASSIFRNFDEGSVELLAGTLRLTDSSINVRPTGLLGANVVIGANQVLDIHNDQSLFNQLNVGSDVSDVGAAQIVDGGFVHADNVNVFEDSALAITGAGSELRANRVQLQSFNISPTGGVLTVDGGATINASEVVISKGEAHLGPGGVINAFRMNPNFFPLFQYGLSVSGFSPENQPTYNQTGGVATLETFRAGENSIVNISDGVLNIQDMSDPNFPQTPDMLGLRMSPSSSFNFSGGHITTDYFSTGDMSINGEDPFNWTGGTLTIGSRTAIDTSNPINSSSFIRRGLSMGSGMRLEIGEEFLVGNRQGFPDPGGQIVFLDVLDGATVDANAMLIGDGVDSTVINSVADSQLVLVTVGGAGSELTTPKLHVGGFLLAEDPSMPGVETFIGGSGRLDILTGGAVSADQVHLGGNQSIAQTIQRQKGILTLLGGTLVTRELIVADPYIDTINPSDPVTHKLGILNFAFGEILLLGDQTLRSSAGLGKAIGDPFNGVELNRNQNLTVENNLDLQTPLTIYGGTLKVGSLSGAQLLGFHTGTLHLTDTDLVLGAFDPIVTIESGQTIITEQTAITPADVLVVINDATLEAEQIDIFGEVQLYHNLATLRTNTLFNFGLLTGHGRIQGDVENTPGGELRNDTGARLSVDGMLLNSGDVNLIGSEVEFNGASANGPDGRVLSRNSVLRFDGGLDNLGLVGLTFGTHDVFGDITNQPGARIVVTGGSQATFYDDINNNGEIRVSDNTSAVFFGELSGAGQITGSGGHVFIEGGLAPGNSPGAMTFGAPLTLGDDAITTIEIAGADLFDQLDLTSVTLDGDLIIELLGDYRPYIGERFEILTFDELIGEFDDILGAYVDDLLALVPIWSDHALDLVATLPGDFDLNGQINVEDLITWAQGFGNGDTFQSGDANLDGLVNTGDLIHWAQNFGLDTEQANALVASSGATAIPEPSGGLGLMAFGLVAMSLRNRRLAAPKAA
ncbi:MAG: hypothetical protein ACYTGQ_06580 [Planctomycetota bacterium]|jgi:hypothetical protein